MVVKPAPKPKKKDHIRVLSNGALYDMNKKRIVGMNPELAEKNTQITKENASEMQALAHEYKREALRRAANAVASQGGGVDGREMKGDYAFIEAIGEAMTMKALTVNDPKAVDAARFVFTETGVSEKQAQKSDIEQATGLIDSVSGLLKELKQAVQRDNVEIIDVD